MTKRYCDVCGIEIAHSEINCYNVRVQMQAEEDTIDSGSAILCKEHGAQIVAAANIKMERTPW
jgi:hypothetical protein